MFVVRFRINGENTDYYFNNIRNARLFERKLLLIVYHDIDYMSTIDYHDLYFYIKNIENTIINFGYNCDNDNLKRWILRHENNEYVFSIETYVEKIETLD